MSIEDEIAAALELQQHGRTEEALDCCLSLLTKESSDFRVHFLAGILFQQFENTPPAISHFSKAVELCPDLAPAHYNLGVLHFSEGKMEPAAESYRRAAELAPDDPDVFFNLALTLKNMGRYPESKNNYGKVLAINPGDTDAHYNLGVLLREMDEPEEAIGSFEKAISLSPSHLAARKHLASLFHLLGHREKALAAYQSILALDPANESALHMTAALAGETPDTPPLSYVQELFDRFSDRYEKTMGEKLESNIEKQLRDMLDSHCGGLRFARGLDMGCGTGLSGLALKDRVRHFTGIDLSAGMLAQAREKKIYQEVAQNDIVSFLEKGDVFYDFFLAADVFVYLGDLRPIFSLVRKKAHPGACFVFSSETCGQGFLLQESGRYAHAEKYIRELAEQCGFSINCCRPARLRKEKGEWISGNLYLLTVAT
ncbi:MAG: tetratricopeptide repeat protein [Pseudomonadota bacterium]